MYPTFAVYPQLMPTVQLFDALHRGREAVLQKKRLKFFWIVFIVIFVWEWFPVRSFDTVPAHHNLTNAQLGIYCPVCFFVCSATKFLTVGLPVRSLASVFFALRTGRAHGSPEFLVRRRCFNCYIRLNIIFTGGAAGNEGLGAFSICFDWAYVGAGGGSIGSLFTPLSTQLSLYAGCAVCM